MKLIALRKVWSLEPTEEAYASAARHWAAEGYDGLEVNVLSDVSLHYWDTSHPGIVLTPPFALSLTSSSL